MVTDAMLIHFKFLHLMANKVIHAQPASTALQTHETFVCLTLSKQELSLRIRMNANFFTVLP